MANQNEFEVEGMSRKVIKPLETAIDEWNTVKEKRMKLTETEVEKKAAVLALMHKYELKDYVYDESHKVVLKDGVKVEKLKTATDGDDED